MFSLHNFYNIIHTNLIEPLHYTGKSMYFFPFGTYDKQMYLGCEGQPAYRSILSERSCVHCYFFDQEPLYDNTFSLIEDSLIVEPFQLNRNLSIVANSEHNESKNKFLKSLNLQDWYYFYHGFAALDWYRDFQYIRRDQDFRFNKVFSCYNHLTSKYRSYRLHLVSNLIANGTIEQGSVSLPLSENGIEWQEIIRDPNSMLSNKARVEIYQALVNVTSPLIADTPTVNGTYSSNLNIDHIRDSLFHVVTETVYFLPKLHLTEKIFKPIVAQRPFILAGAPGNLAYLKSYGFRTFDQWIDESYDQITDNTLRIHAISKEIEKLCKLTKSEQKDMLLDMQEVLYYNFNHFYTDFKTLIVNELVDNFSGILSKWNNGKQPGNHSRHHWRVEFDDPAYLNSVKQLLLR
jgi:hypothetical protein